MEENQQSPVETTQKTSGDETSAAKDKVAYDTYRKALSEKKNVQSENEKLRNELEQIRNEKLKAEGKKDDVIKSYEEKIAALEKENRSTKQSFAWSTLTGKIKEEALKHGCSNPDKLIKLMDDNELNSIQIGDDFTIDTESVSKVIEKSKQENFFLFSNSSKKIADGTPSVKIDEKEDISKLSNDELKEKIKSLYK